MKLNLEVLKELDLEPRDGQIAMALRFYNPYFSIEFVDKLRNELLNKLLMVSIGVDHLTASDQLVLELFDDLCSGLLLNKENEKEDND
jgi:hypothetical protein